MKRKKEKYESYAIKWLIDKKRMLKNLHMLIIPISFIII